MKVAPLCVVVLSACAAIRAGTPIPAELVYDAPLERVWPEVRTLIRGHGFNPSEDLVQHVLVTDWRHDDIGAWTRLMAIGKRLPDGRSVVRIFQNQRASRPLSATDSASEMEAPPVNGLTTQQLGHGEWNPDGAPSASITNNFRGMNGRSGGAAPTGFTGTPALGLEAELRTRLVPVVQWTHDAKVDMSTIPGAAPLLQDGTVLVLGDQYGTQEIPALVGRLAELASTSHRVTVGLEINRSEQLRIARYLHSEGSEDDRARLLSGGFWRRPYQDGRSSQAAAELIEQLRKLVGHRHDVAVIAFDEAGVGNAHEEAMARNFEATRQTRPGGVAIVLTGNVHARTADGVAWDESLVPFAARLKKRGEPVVALDVQFGKGRAWQCRVGSKLDCATGRIAPAMHKVPDGVGPTWPAPFIARWSQPSAEGFDGIFFVDELTPSPPAVTLEAHVVLR